MMMGASAFCALSFRGEFLGRDVSARYLKALMWFTIGCVSRLLLTLDLAIATYNFTQPEPLKYEDEAEK